MKFVLISGSHREHSQSAKVAHFTAQRLSMRGHETHVLELARNPLPLWDEGVWQGSEAWRQSWGPFSEQLKSADGLVIVTPEWGGMVPPGLKNLFLLCNQNEMRHKPGLIIAVSAGVGGSYPVAELRMSSYKNSGICYLPEHIIVRSAEKMLNDAPSDPTQSPTPEDTYIRGRLDYALTLLEAYTTALKPIRESGILSNAQYPNGM